MDEYNGIKVEDLIKTQCFKGYLEVIAIEKRFYTKDDELRHNIPSIKEGQEYSPLIRFVYRYNESGVPVERKAGSVDAAYAILASTHIEKEIKKLKETTERLNMILQDEYDGR